MNRTGRQIVIGALLVGAFGCSSLGADAWDNSPLGEAQWGEVWQGSPAGKDYLQGGAVVLLFWRYDQKATLEPLVELTTLSKKYERMGLRGLAAHVGQAEEDAALKVVEEKGGIDCTILSSAKVPGLDAPTAPYAVIFDDFGRALWKGDPTETGGAPFRDAVKKSLLTVAEITPAERTEMILGDKTYKHVKQAVSRIKAGRLGSAWKSLETILVTGKKQEQEARAENADLRGRVQDYIRAQEGFADAWIDESPVLCIKILEKLAGEFQGSEVGEKMQQRMQGLSRDLKFKKEFKAEKEYMPLEKKAEKIPPRPTDEKELDAWKKRNAGAVKSLQRMAAAFQKEHPDTTFAAKADELVKAFGEAD
jgi:hypothetical protein